ncbi:MAG: sialidase family protein [Vicinamibacterales bacterium]
MLLRTSLSVSLLVVSLVSCGPGPRAGSSSSGASWPAEPQLLDAPPAASSLLPHLASTPEGAILSWVATGEGSARLDFAEYANGAWSTVRTAASGPDWFLSWADVPSVMRLSNGTLVAQWLRSTEPLFEAYDLELSFSTDEGQSWATPFTPHHDGTTTQHGFGSLFETAGGGLGLIWLDGRAAELDLDDPDGGAMSVRYAAYDQAWQQVADAVIDERVCECCPTDVALSAAGPLAVFRDRSPSEVRDIAVARLVGDTWSEPAIVHDDGWQIPACPVNGPAISARGAQVVVTWFTVAEERGQAWAAFSDDGGDTWGVPLRLDGGSALGRVAVQMVGDGAAVAAWVEFVNGRAELRLRRIAVDGTSGPAIPVAGTGARLATSIPRLLRLNDAALLLAWTESGASEDSAEDATSQVRVARIPLGTAP